MALTATTLTAPVTVNDTTIKVTSATGFAKGNVIRLNGEVLQQSGEAVLLRIPVIRGVNGSTARAHPTASKVITGLGSDFPESVAGSETPVSFPVQPNRPVFSYSAAGALTGAAGLHLLNGTGALAMTLAVPTTLQDGEELIIIGNGKAAHTVTVTGGIGAAGAGYTVLTFDTGGQCSVRLMAANAVWVSCPSPLSGTLTAVDVAVA